MPLSTNAYRGSFYDRSRPLFAAMIPDNYPTVFVFDLASLEQFKKILATLREILLYWKTGSLNS